jgi:hypothetical protein
MPQPPVDAPVVTDPTLLQVAIVDPPDGMLVSGIVPVSGSANVPEFASYELQYGESHDPGAFSQPIYEPVGGPVVNGLLGQWDTTGLSNGPHTLRLLVRDAKGAQYEARVRVFVENNAATPTQTTTPTQLPPTELPPTQVPPTPLPEQPTPLPPPPTATPLPPSEPPTPTPLDPNPTPVDPNPTPVDANPTPVEATPTYTPEAPPPAEAPSPTPEMSTGGAAGDVPPAEMPTETPAETTAVAPTETPTSTVTETPA